MATKIINIRYSNIQNIIRFWKFNESIIELRCKKKKKRRQQQKIKETTIRIEEVH